MCARYLTNTLILNPVTAQCSYIIGSLNTGKETKAERGEVTFSRSYSKPVVCSGVLTLILHRRQPPSLPNFPGGSSLSSSNFLASYPEGWLYQEEHLPPFGPTLFIPSDWTIGSDWVFYLERGNVWTIATQ